jgi:hypothetical protein
MNDILKVSAKLSIAALSVGMLLFWVYLQFIPTKTQPINYYFNLGVGLIYLIVGAISLSSAAKDIKKPMKSFMNLYGLALISWAVASLVWGYYNLVLHTDVPYPSISDYFFILYSLLLGASFWFYFDIFQARITKSSLRDSLLIVVGIYFLIFFVLNKPAYDQSTPLIEVIFNYLYPLLDATVLSLAVVILRLEEKNNISNIIPLVLGVLAQVVGDILFSYRTANNLYWNGDVSDLFYLISGVLCFITILKLNIDFNQLLKQYKK